MEREIKRKEEEEAQKMEKNVYDEEIKHRRKAV